MEAVKRHKDTNVCGIVGFCVSWFIPLAGFVLGIIALSRKEKTTALGVLAIIISIIAWMFGMAIFARTFIGG